MPAGASLSAFVQDSNIAWTSDRTQLYGNYTPSFFNQIPSLRGGATINGTVRDDQHFLVWMRPGAARTVRKLYAQINEDIPAGDCRCRPGDDVQALAVFATPAKLVCCHAYIHMQPILPSASCGGLAIHALTMLTTSAITQSNLC